MKLMYVTCMTYRYTETSQNTVSETAALLKTGYPTVHGTVSVHCINEQYMYTKIETLI